MLIDWLTLYYTKHIGAKRLMQLVAHFDSATLAVNASNSDWRKAGMTDQVIAARADSSRKKAESALLWMESDPLNHIIVVTDERYPELLRICDDPPALLFVRGNPDILSNPQLGIVGTRHPTKEGEQNAYHFAKQLGEYGLTITSGLAMGIDQFAHDGTLASPSPTIAVLGTGLNEIYPKHNRRLAEKIVAHNGALVSEFPLHTPPIPNNFPKRNRIIAGLSLGVLVVEAADQSGSLITARLANESSREVFAIPSSIHNPQSKGCHRLIREGAKLVESTFDIFSELKHWLPKTNASEPQPTALTPLQPVRKIVPAPTDPIERQIFELLTEPLTIDDIVVRTQLDTHIATQAIMMMELEGTIVRQDSQHFIQGTV
ncbi:DNA-processing protein DprA [Wohlfahrtiimonas chitiniclastica]|uniref:DNA-processing protein DprA n=1 Tax=Wohlfahrtiimonas chitiniclastica TaxID=400946 RepID=UPI0007B41D28|nr:DNA-processing protein DprA [Wohlfahrtiimonas chitiniclastica]MBS7814717.1 DNA-processing protein DprA [Wohlfahrtiimonas chitiniclastica]MBS7834766.1 DNA-processing protein DprA [Wohlfahrtiimonas chitiniclastica]WHR54694.1 DNA-processing protein DprA [Wohlfahrtiimonas chitiniclastica]